MALKEQIKGSVSGSQVNSVSTPRKGNVIARVASYLKRQPKVHYIIKIPKTHPIGKVMYTVESTIEPVTFYKRKDAELFKRLLNKTATQDYKADIIRREVTDEGYIPIYPGDRK